MNMHKKRESMTGRWYQEGINMHCYEYEQLLAHCRLQTAGNGTRVLPRTVPISTRTAKFTFVQYDSMTYDVPVWYTGTSNTVINTKTYNRRSSTTHPTSASTSTGVLVDYTCARVLLYYYQGWQKPLFISKWFLVWPKTTEKPPKKHFEKPLLVKTPSNLCHVEKLPPYT